MPPPSAADEGTKQPSGLLSSSAHEKSHSKQTEKRESTMSRITNGEALPFPDFPNPKPGEKPTPAPARNQSKGWRGMLEHSDHFILRLNELVKPAKGFGSVLATFNYTLYLLAYLNAKAAPLRSNIRHKIGHDDASMMVSTQEFRPSRLFSLIPRYVRMRELLQGVQPGQEWTLHKIAVVQCLLHGVHEFLDNVAFLTEHRIVPRRISSWFSKGPDHRAASIYTLAYRVWFLAFSCDIISLFWALHLTIHHQDALKDTDKTVKTEKQRLYTELFFPLAGLPVGWQLSGRAEDAIPGFNRSLSFAFGVIKDVAKTSKLWDETKVFKVTV